MLTTDWKLLTIYPSNIKRRRIYRKNNKCILPSASHTKKSPLNKKIRKNVTKQNTRQNSKPGRVIKSTGKNTFKYLSAAQKEKYFELLNESYRKELGIDQIKELDKKENGEEKRSVKVSFGEKAMFRDYQRGQPPVQFMKNIEYEQQISGLNKRVIDIWKTITLDWMDQHEFSE